jgi:hypothetical protein
VTAQAPGGPMVVPGTVNEPGTVRIGALAAVVDAAGAFRWTVATRAGTRDGLRCRLEG